MDLIYVIYMRLSSEEQPDVLNIACGGSTDDPSAVAPPSIEGEEITDLLAGTYTVTVTDNNLCTASKDIDLVYSGSSCLRIPTVLTPNGDGHNDVWRIGNIEIYPNVVIDIYTRWGKHIFHSDKGYSTPWDGRYKGKLMPMDSYHYIINLGDGSDPITGNITIIR